MIKWPHKISNEDLYKRTKEVKWSSKIKTRRLRWVGHLMRLPEETPARIALQEALKPVRRPAGRPKQTWIATINQDLKNLNPDLQLGTSQLEEDTADRKKWNALVRNGSAVPTTGGKA